MAQALAVPFKARMPARRQRCIICNRQAHSLHHWTSQHTLRIYMRGRAQAEHLTPEQTRAELRALLRDPLNLSPVCSWHHMGGDPVLGGGFRVADVPPSAWVFAAALGDEWSERLRRTYP